MMSIEAWIALACFIMSLLVNVIIVVVFLVKQSDNLKFLKETFETSKTNVMKTVGEYKKEMTEKFDELKKDINNQIDKNQKYTEEHIKRLEQKQDKHNNLVERMVRVEDSTKSSHHRIDTIEDRLYDKFNYRISKTE